MTYRGVVYRTKRTGTASIASVFDPGVMMPSGLVGYVPDWASSPADQDEKHVNARVKDLQTV